MTKLTELWARTGLGIKLSLTNFLIIAILTGILISAIAYSVSSAIEQREGREMTTRSNLLKSLISASDQDLRNRAGQLANSFQKALSSPIEVTDYTVDVNGTTTPLMLANGKPINLTYDVVDPFTAATGAVATVFVRTGNDFVRISTSLSDQNKQRVIGTKLSPDSAAYEALRNGQSYTGLATLFGRQYMTHYAPLSNAQGDVVGASFVGLDFSEFLTALKDSIRELTVGDTGYYYVLNARPGPQYGQLIIHPAQEGQVIIDSKDADGRLFIKELMQARDGVMHYPWINTALGETVARDKLVAFTYYPEWEWIIAGGTYTDEYTQDIKELILGFVLIGLIALAIVCALWYWLIQKMIVRPITSVGNVAETIATGDLTAVVRSNRRDEIGQLMAAINKITFGLTRVVGSVRANSHSVATASTEIAQGNLDLSARTESQASALTETAASMEELEATVRQNTDNAGTANQLAAEASTVAERGGKVVSEVVDTMQGINDSSRRIADIIGVIDSIAFQTNILALNAAVEAARAGQHGQGFAVVATEVRSLSARSASAAKEIRELINDSVQRVEDGTTLVHRAGTTMSEVVASIHRVTDIMSEISSASVQQQAGVGQIAEAVTQMDQATQQNAALVEEMAAAATSLRQQSDDLVDAVSVFRLAQDTTSGAAATTHALTR